ncbi:MAG: hypothetical protein ACLR77_11210 [Oscillospiraceae bacterium]
MNLRTILFSQYPALFLLAVLFLIAHLRVRKTSAVKSVLWVILFGVALAASVVCCFLGIQAELWTLKTLITLGFWSWFGVGLVLLFLVLRVVHGMEKRSSRRRLDKAMKQAEKQKEEEVSAPAPRAPPPSASAPRRRPPRGQRKPLGKKPPVPRRKRLPRRKRRTLLPRKPKKVRSEYGSRTFRLQARDLF